MQGLRWVSRGFEDRPVWGLRWCLLIFWCSTFHAHVIETKGTIHRQMGHICGMIDWSFHKGELDFQTRNPPQPLETGQLLQPLWRIQRSVYISFASTARAASLLMVKKRRWLERGKDLESMKNHEFYGVRGFYCQISLLKGSCQSWWKKSWRGFVRMENGMQLKRLSDCCRCDDVVHIYREFDIEFVLFQECSDLL